MTTNKNIPYQDLFPEVILAAVESVGFTCNGSLLALNSYENRVYQIGIEDDASMIAKFYRPQRWSNVAILEEHRFALELMEHEIPVVAPWMSLDKKTLHTYQGYRFALFPRWGGRALELDNLEQLQWMGRFIGRLHAVAACKKFQHRTQLTVQNYGYDNYQFLLKENFIPAELKTQFSRTVETVLEKVEQQFAALGTITTIRLHGDMHAGNVLWSDTGPHIVDLDDCMMGPAIQDIWMLLSGNERQVETEIECIMQGYQAFHDFNYAELNLIESLRTLRLLYYAAWLARRWEDPAFPMNFPWFNTRHYWQELLQNMQQQLEII